MDAAGWSSIVTAVTGGAADIISSTKGNYSKNATSFGIGVGGTAQAPATGLSGILPIAILGIVVLLMSKLFKRK